MILDPRLVPWSAVAPGVILALTLATWALFIRRRSVGLAILAAAPIAGWVVTTSLLRGFPDFPPATPTEWALPFSIFGTILCLTGHRKPGCQGCIAAIARAIYLPALWWLLFKPVFHFNAGSLAWKVLAFALIGMAILALYAKRAGRWASAEYVPWVIALGAASACLVITGSAALGTLALALCLSALPAALAVFWAVLRGRSFSIYDDEDSPREEGPSRQSFLSNGRNPPGVKRRPQGMTLPLAFALPALMCSGPLYASTTWGIACLVLAAPVCGFFALRGMDYYVQRQNRGWPSRKQSWRQELAACAVALGAAAIPAGIATYIVLSAAATREQFY